MELDVAELEAIARRQFDAAVETALLSFEQRMRARGFAEQEIERRHLAVEEPVRCRNVFLTSGLPEMVREIQHSVRRS
jgi:hypothetical protein